MRKRERRSHLLLSKIIFTVLMLLLYIIGRSIPLYSIDPSEYLNKHADATRLLSQTISGDLNQCSLLALGIFPYMMASMGQQIVMSLMSSKNKSGISPVKSNRIMVAIMLVLAIYQAVMRVTDLKFVPGNGFLLPRIIAALQLVVGSFVILWMSERNTKYGVGGQTALIFVNILDGFTSVVRQCDISRYWLIMICIVLGTVVVTLFMENTQKRIPLQRISVQNIYGDTDYQAIKLNPIGIMPVMFASGLMMLPQLLVQTLLKFNPNNTILIWWNTNLSMDRYFGVGVYLFCLFFLTICFSAIFLNPKEITENLLQSGDSFEGVHPGKKTKRYLLRNIFTFGIISSVVMGICIAVPRLLAINGVLDEQVSMLPTSVLMLVGMWINLYQEIQAVGKIDKYRSIL